jgi:hypothetical protein
VAPAISRRCVVLLDTSAATHGGPRILQALALFALSARARRAKASFSWGFIHQQTLHDGLDAHGLKRCAKGACWVAPTAPQLDHWREALRDSDHLDDV